jgi:hypothetical protein
MGNGYVIIIGFLAFIGLGLVGMQGETLYDCRVHLASDKATYNIGENVRLIISVIPNKPRFLTLSEDLHQSVRIWNVQNQSTDRFDRGQKVKYQLSPARPLNLEVLGRVVSDEAGITWVDFGKFGRICTSRKEFPELRCSVIPYTVRRFDSADWLPSNDLALKLN